jgi:formamidopyrimidine-DNA glycosylase
MPELPEVETIRRSLESHLVGRRIVGLTVREPRLRERVHPAALRRACVGREIVGLGRRAKYLLCHLAGGQTLIIHLGMSGRIVLEPAERPLQPHDHLQLRLDDGRELRFHDPRRFGRVTLCETERLADHPLFRHLGPEPLGPDFTGAYLAERARGRRLAVKNFLMDGRIVVGIGNIYACEALHVATIHPGTATGRIRPPRWARLAAAVREVLEDSLRAGGTSFNDYVDGNGRAGLYQLQTQVYGRAGEPCRRCGAPIRRILQGARSTFYCPRCQH